MKYVLLLLPLSILTACNQMGSHTNRVTDSTAGVHLIPHDSPDQNMPVIPTDTTASNMPTLDPDTGKVQPK